MRHKFRIQPGVLVIALDARNKEVYVVRVRREIDGIMKEVLELPGGGIEKAEAPLAAAARELLEETGVRATSAAKWIQLYDNNGIDPIDAYITTQQHAFLLLSAEKVQDPTNDEAVQIITKPLSSLIDMDRHNGFDDPLTPYALRRAFDWLSDNQPDLAS